MPARRLVLVLASLVLTSVGVACSDSNSPAGDDTGGQTGGSSTGSGSQTGSAGNLGSTAGSSGNGTGSGDGTGTGTGTGTEDIGGNFNDVLDETKWASMFPNRNALYAYASLATAAKDYPKFLTEGDAKTRKREAAAFLANIAHETTGGWDTAPGGRYAWGLYFTQEVGCESGACTGYCDSSNTKYPCAPGKTYHGRGPIQLSWNYNYGQVGDVLGIDLLHNPDLVTSDGVTAFKTAIWFWMTPQAPKPSAHDVMVGNWTPSAADTAAGRAPGFGMTINIINGGIECGYTTPAQVKDRIGFYEAFTTALGTDEGANVSCDQMHSY